MPSSSGRPNTLHRQPSDRAGDPVAIEIERGEVGRADVGDDIHLHAVDDGEEILAPQAEVADRPRRKPRHPPDGLPA